MARGKQCAACQSPLRSLIETCLQEGHTTSCIAWHLWRLGRRIHPGNLQRHREAHLGLGHSAGLRVPIGWHFTPYIPQRRCLNAAPELLLIRGLPYSGKTPLACTFTETHAHIEADLFFADHTGDFDVAFGSINRATRSSHLWCQTWTQALLRQGLSVVVANTFVRQWEIAVYCEIAAEAGAIIRVLELPEAPNRPYPHHMIRFVGYLRNRWEPSPVTAVSATPPSPDDPLPSVSYQCQPGVCNLGIQEEPLASELFQDIPLDDCTEKNMAR